MVLAAGCFDGLHAGHVTYLDAAKGLCQDAEPLVVAVASDGYVKQAKKRSPAYTHEDRVLVVAALTCVDVVVTHSERGAAEAIRVLRPRLFVKGADWRLKGLPDDDQIACVEVGASIVFVEETETPHTSEIRH